jgi:hypothetical protein
MIVDVVEICKRVLARLVTLDYEKETCSSLEHLIFPNKYQEKGDVKRISEQELRLLFIEEFIKEYPKLYYSIETPTTAKYNFGDDCNGFKVGIGGQSASHDMCVFERVSNEYERKLNIEFKHKNGNIKNISKDILKLLNESSDGAFIHLLDSTRRNTLRNINNTGVFDKLGESFGKWKLNWTNGEKVIQLVILSLNQKSLIHREIAKSDLKKLDEIFFASEECGNILSINRNGWKTIKF